MADHEVFENKDDAKHKQEHERRVAEAFGSLHTTVGERASERDIERLRNIREAVVSGDRTRAKEHITATRTESSWLYEELMKHPEISLILRELSIMGF
jgi:hypothetical protein